MGDFELAHSLIHYENLRERLEEASLTGRPIRWRVLQARAPILHLAEPVNMQAEGWSVDIRKTPGPTQTHVHGSEHVHVASSALACASSNLAVAEATQSVEGAMQGGSFGPETSFLNRYF